MASGVTLSAVTITTSVVTLPDASSFLLVDLAITCEGCGEHRVRLAGHHLAVLAARFAELVREYPALTGEVGEIEVEDLGYGRGGTPHLN